MIPILRHDRPRLLLTADGLQGAGYPVDAGHRRILGNVVADCELYANVRPWRGIPRRPDSPHPYHQLYLTFYTAMQATALLENYAFAWRLTGDRRWLSRARAWLRAATAWEHHDEVEEHFYTANRYMQAFAMALDLLDDVLPAKEKRQATQCLVRLLERWWPDVDSQRHSIEGGHHAVVDNGHFGVAALHLLGDHPQAQVWVEAVIDRFRAAIMPHGCGPAGEPVDGPTFWPWENLWLLQFVDALRLVTGIDLYKEFPSRLPRSLVWFRDHLAAPKTIPDQLYYPANANVLLGSQLDACSPALLRFAQEAGDGSLRQTALADPRLGRLYRFGAGVKGSPAECMVAYGPYAYCYYDPNFRPSAMRATPPLARKYAAHYGHSAVLRSGRDPAAAILCISGYGGGTAHGFMNLHLQWAGHPVLRTISAAESQPVGCGSLPCVGGQNEVVAVPGRLSSTPDWQRLQVGSLRTEHEYWLSPGAAPVVLVALRRRARGVRCVGKDGAALFRLSGRDALQYDADPWFGANAGTLRLRFRLHTMPDGPGVLFNTGLGVGGISGPGVNTFALVVEPDGSLRFTLQSQRAHEVSVTSSGCVEVGQWHEAAITWGGFNRRHARPRIEIVLDGKSERLQDLAAFGEVGKDSIGLASLSVPRTFYIHPHAALAFGGAVQTPSTAVACDLGLIDLRCPGHPPLRVDPEHGWGLETGCGELTYKMNPVALRDVRGRAGLVAGRRIVDLIPVFGEGLQLQREEVPFAPAGLAAGSLKSFVPGAGETATRLQAKTGDDVLVLAFASRSARALVRRDSEGFQLRVSEREFAFDVARRRGPILRLRTGGSNLRQEASHMTGDVVQNQKPAC